MQNPVIAALQVGLESLRWREDMVITNYWGERVWLRPSYDAAGNRTGITDCCYEDNPCNHHKRGAEKL